MFTGIVQGIAKVSALRRAPGLISVDVEFPEGALSGLNRGASVALDGVCLTATEFGEKHATFDMMQETLDVTSLGQLQVGSQLNFERAAAHGAEVGGHVLSGHIDCKARIAKIDQPQNNYVITFEVEERWAAYVFSKGYIAINGTSLTVTDARLIRERGVGEFKVWLIPETLRMTTFGVKQVGDLVNVEIERQTQIIVDTVTSFLERNAERLFNKG